VKKALITGVTGQDGSYLADFLLEKGYEVHGIIRRASTLTTQRVDHLYQDPHMENATFFLHYGDLTDGSGLRKIVGAIRPDEVYNLAAQSHVRVSFDQPAYTADVAGLGALRLLEALRDHETASGQRIRYYQASSSEMFGSTEPPQSEESPFHPRSPYAVGKLAGHWFTINYREAYGMYAVSGILFNHESPRRGETFVTRKITRAVGRIKQGLQKTLYLGNLAARRDWGFAGDYVQAMWRMLQQDDPEDFIVATGEAHSVQEFLEYAFQYADLDWRAHVEIDPKYFRPSEVDSLLGDPRRARDRLGWEAETTFEELVKKMVDHDMELARQEKTLRDAGHTVPGQRGADG